MPDCGSLALNSCGTVMVRDQLDVAHFHQNAGYELRVIKS